MDISNTEAMIGISNVEHNLPPQLERLTPQDTVLMICDNGRNRSKYSARYVANLGYNARVLGIKDYGIDEDDKKKAIAEAVVLVPLASDVRAQLELFIQQRFPQSQIEDKLKQILEVDIPENIHWALSQRPNERVFQKAQKDLESLLGNAGFKDLQSAI